MIAFPSLLASAAQAAGMKTPVFESGSEEVDPNEFPHFFVFCIAQLGRAMQPGEHWENAKVIAGFSDEAIKNATVEDLTKAGFMGLA